MLQGPSSETDKERQKNEGYERSRKAGQFTHSEYLADLYILRHRKSPYKHSLMLMHLDHVRRRYAIEKSGTAAISNSYSVVRV